MPNRLQHETSPYLLQHAANPVDWYPWGPQALERAAREDKPILLSVGYSACHWCHVMAHESFEDPGVAEVMNRHFVCVKVDREERPDIDQIYQAAHQMLARRAGGWPLTMFLSPDGAPFFGGTYFPKSPRHGLPGFAGLCERIALLWRERRAEIAAQNEELLKAFSLMQPRGAAAHDELSAAPVAALLANLRASFDARHGGFGGAPKFPHPADLELCLRGGEADMARVTLERMCEGGIFDQLEGGFCRYSTDAQWSIPHFEKMLYDNGPLLGLLADAWLVAQQALFERCAARTAQWMMNEMQSAEGGYFSSLDADSEGEEGRFYVWDREEVRTLLTPEEYAVLAPHFGLDAAPNFEGRHWHLRIVRALAESDRSTLDPALEKLRAARRKRVAPGRDEKVLVSWNALAIRGMARAGRVFGRPEYTASALRAVDFIREEMWSAGGLLATYKDGRAHLDAYLDDYAFLLAALLELMQAEFRLEDLRFAQDLAGALLERFEDPEDGGFFFTAHDHETLIHRPKPGHDNATPSGNAVAAWALGRLAALTGEARYERSQRRALALFYPALRDYSSGFATMAMALQELLSPPKLLVLRGRPPELARWHRSLAREHVPDMMTLALADGLPGLAAPLDKPPRPEPVNGWLCRGVICLEPISDLVKLTQAIKETA